MGYLLKEYSRSLHQLAQIERMCFFIKPMMTTTSPEQCCWIWSLESLIPFWHRHMLRYIEFPWNWSAIYLLGNINLVRPTQQESIFVKIEHNIFIILMKLYCYSSFTIQKMYTYLNMVEVQATTGRRAMLKEKSWMKKYLILLTEKLMAVIT